jgi:hypothetical protein
MIFGTNNTQHFRRVLAPAAKLFAVIRTRGPAWRTTYRGAGSDARRLTSR